MAKPSSLYFLAVRERVGRLFVSSGTVTSGELVEDLRDTASGVARSAPAARAFVRATSGVDGEVLTGSLQRALGAVTGDRHPLYQHDRLIMLNVASVQAVPERLVQTPAQNLQWWLEHATPTSALVALYGLAGAELLSVPARVRRCLQKQSAAIHRTPTSLLPNVAVSAAHYRHELAAAWWTAARVARALDSTAVNTSQLPSLLRRQGRLLGVWVPAERSYRYPPWQFHHDGTLVGELQPILSTLRDGGVTGRGRRASGWHEVEWFLTPHVLLDDRTPADCMPTAPERVLAVVRQEFVEKSGGSTR